MKEASNEFIPFATAVRYGIEDSSKVVARGEGDAARQIIDTAQAFNIPIIQDFHLSQRFAAFRTGDEIPEHLYYSLACLLDYLFELETRFKDEIDDRPDTREVDARC